MIKALAITGPTASGKTALSLSVARNLDGEIISADSMQIYRYMDIGTAKATAEERATAPHHLLDIVDPKDSYSCEAYRADAMRVAEDITDRGRLPIFVGGTGLYIDTLLRRPTDLAPPSDPEYGARLLSGLAPEEAPDILWQRLSEVDPDSAQAIHKNNLRRVIRALEIYDATGMTKSHLDRLSRSEASDIGIGLITIDFHDRELLYERIDRRVGQMMEEGLADEVTELYRRGLLTSDSTAGQAIGYKELISYIEGRESLNSAIEQIKLSSRRYAKRQLTWFRRYANAYRLYADRPEGGMRSAEELASEAVTVARELIGHLS